MSKAQVEEAVYAADSGATWIRIACPWCGNETPSKRNMSVTQDSSFYQCHRCGERGFYRPLVPSLESLRVKLSAPEPEVEEKKPALPFHFKPLFLSPLMTEDEFFWEYMVRRGVHPEVFVSHGVGYCVAGFYAGSVVVPFWHEQELVGFVARNLTDRQYRYPKGFRREQVMFNMDRLHDDEPLVIVEGVFDALPHDPYTAAVLGKPTRNHFDMIEKSGLRSDSRRKRFYFMLDGDARSENWAAVKLLQRRGVDAVLVKTPSGKDPGDLNPEQFHDIITQGIT